MAKQIELRRHADNDGDQLTQEGVEAALRIGSKLAGDYQLLVSSGAQRATQTLACFVCALGESVPGGAIVEPGFRSDREDRWRETYQQAGSGELETMRSADPDFVAAEAATLGEALQRVLDQIDDGQRALAVGHSPTTEAAVLGLTGEIVGSLSKGEGLLLVAEGADYRIEPL